PYFSMDVILTGPLGTVLSAGDTTRFPAEPLATGAVVPTAGALEAPGRALASPAPLPSRSSPRSASPLGRKATAWAMDRSMAARQGEAAASPPRRAACRRRARYSSR
ncbi:MAG: hypothetical protein WKG00_36115, partial [Polyangiaceae bacterium]